MGYLGWSFMAHSKAYNSLLLKLISRRRLICLRQILMILTLCYLLILIADRLLHVYKEKNMCVDLLEIHGTGASF